MSSATENSGAAWTLCCAAAAFSLYYLFKAISKRNEFLEVVNRMPGPETWPLIGNSHLLWSSGKSVPETILPLFAALNNVHGKEGIFRFHVATNTIIHLTKLDTISTLLKSTVHIDKPFEYVLLDRFIGGGLLTSGGDQWRKNRKVLTPAFHSKIIEDFVPVVNKHSRTLCAGLSTNNEPEDLMKPVMNLSLDIILESSMGTNEDIQGTKDHPYVDALMTFGPLFMTRLFNPLLWNETFYYNFTPAGQLAAKCIKTMHEFTFSAIRNRKREMVLEQTGDVGKKRGEPLIDILLRSHLFEGTMTEAEVRREVDTFTFAGFDTTSSAISFALFHLGLNHDAQEKLFSELSEVVGVDQDRDISLEDLKRLPYLEMVVKECLRLTPSVPVVARLLNEPIVIKGYTIPAEVSSVWMHIHLLHRDPELYPDPDKFDPERFSAEECAKRDPMAYVPFSGGSRNCIGQKFALNELKIVVAHVVRLFKVESLMSYEDLRITNEMVTKTSVPMKVKFTRRNI